MKCTLGGVLTPLVRQIASVGQKRQAALVLKEIRNTNKQLDEIGNTFTAKNLNALESVKMTVAELENTCLLVHGMASQGAWAGSVEDVVAEFRGLAQKTENKNKLHEVSRYQTRNFIRTTYGE